MANPRRFWGWFAGSIALAFGAVDIACAIGPANGDTFSEVLAAHLDTPARRIGFAVVAELATAGFVRHILKERT